MLGSMRASLASTQISDDVTVSASIRSVTLSAAYALLASDAAAPKSPTVTTAVTAVMKCKWLAMDDCTWALSGVKFRVNSDLTQR